MNIYKGLLFLHGHLLQDDEIAASAANDDAATARANDAPRHGRGTFNALESLLFLGGRPMHPDQPYDREEPFDQLQVSQVGQAPAAESRCA